MKKLLFLLSFVILSNFFFIKNVNAVVDGFVSDCLQAAPAGHTAGLTIKAGSQIMPQGDTDTWVFVCITSPELTGTKCTTGDGAIDQQLFDKSDDLTALQGIQTEEGTTVGGVDGGQNPPRKTNADGTAFTNAVSWSDAYLPGVIHQWAWVQAANPAGAGGVETGGLGAQQQGTFDFTKLSGDTSKCAKIGWDPRGYVFDAATLNPVGGVQVTLSKGPKGGAFTDVPSGLGITNPDTTKPLTPGGVGNGQYSFYVEPGFYKLRLTSANATIANLASVNSAYQDLFLSKEGKTNIYQKDQEVEEVKGMVAIAHIPVTVTDPSMLITTLQTLEKGLKSENGQINIFGRVSHPKSKMLLKMEFLDEAGALIVKDEVRTTAIDDLGEYDEYIDQEQVDAEGKTLFFQNLTVDFELNSFYTTGAFSAKKDTNTILQVAKKVWDFISKKITVSAASSTSFTVKPIPSYIEGVAYDNSGRSIPQAIVGVYTKFSNKPWFVTVADEQGQYKIGSQYLPQFEYELRYKKPTGEVIVVDTSTFIKQNVKFFVAEGIKPYEQKKSSSTEDFAAQVKVSEVVKETDLQAMAKVGSSKGTGLSKSGNGGINNMGTSEVTPSATNGTGTAGSGAMMIAVVIFILVLLGAGAFVMMKSKQTTTQF